MRLGVAAQDDVGAAAGHVRGDRHRALAAGLGDDLRLALVVLGVQHLVLDAALARACSEISSLFSIDTVPTRIGRPRRSSCRDSRPGDPLLVPLAPWLELDLRRRLP